MEEGGALAEHQYDFRKVRSTTQALQFVHQACEETGNKWLVLLTLDVKNALNPDKTANILFSIELKLNFRFTIFDCI